MDDEHGITLGEGRVLRATEKAILVQLDTGAELWLPKSVIHDDSECYDEGHEGEVVVERWFAEKEGLA